MTPIARMVVRGPRLASPERIRETLLKLGPTYVKLGQYLALRPDLIGPDYARELLGLVDAVPAQPFRLSRRILDQDLGPAASGLTRIDRVPVGAGSLAQVYRARTADGTVVAVKVQRDDVARLVQRDLSRARLLTRLLVGIGLAPGVSPQEVLAELRTWMNEELDMERELGNLTRMWELSERSRLALVPAPIPELSGRRVLTTEYVAGTPFSDLLRLLRKGRGDYIARLGLDRDALAASLIETVLEQIFRFELFHADTHPGNLIALPDDRVGFVDFALVDTLDPVLRDGLSRYLRAVYSGDSQEMLRGLMDMLVETPYADREQFRQAFLEQTRRWRRERAVGRTEGRGSPAGRYLVGLLEAARGSGFRVPPALLSMYRSLLTAENLANELSADVDLVSVGRAFFLRLELENLQRRLEPGEVQREVLATADFLRNGPREIQRVLSDLADDRFVLRVETTESGVARDRADQRARLVAAAVSAVALSVLVVGLRDVEVARVVSVSALLAVPLAVVNLYVVLLWRRLR